MVLAPTSFDPIALWAIPVHDLAGVARHVLDVVEQGVPGWRIVVLAPPGPLADRCTEIGGAVLAAPFGPSAGTARSIMTLRQAIRRLRPAVVHSHLAFADVVAPLAALGTRGTRCPVVSTEHGIARDDLVYHASQRRARVMAAVHHQRLRGMRGVICVSEATAREVQAKWRPPERLVTRVIPNGIDTSSAGAGADAAGRPGLRIGTLSRLAPEKGLFDLLDAFALVHHRHPDATLRIAGDGDLDAELRERMQNLGLGSAASLCGFVDPHQFLHEIDVLAQFSVWENCSYSILDALAAPAGVVATAVGGNPELLPAACLVPRQHADAAAERLIEQGLHVDRRPTLPCGWPTVSDMCKAIGAFYDEVAA